MYFLIIWNFYILVKFFICFSLIEVLNRIYVLEIKFIENGVI